MAWTSDDFDRAFRIAKPSAEAGEPWAQLRLGIFHANGWGTAQDVEKAEYWYRKAAAQKASGDWAEGRMVGAAGRSGYFNQNGDARIAEFNLAQLLYDNDRNLPEARALIESVIKESDGKSIFFCCEFSGGRYFHPSDFLELKEKIEKKLASR
jgi:TPR repeat protein